MRDWKMRDWNYRHHVTGGGKCGTGKFGNGKSMERHVWHNLVAHNKHREMSVHLTQLSRTVPVTLANILTTLLTYVQHFRRFLFQYSGRFSELLCYIALLNALVNCMICYMNSNSIALTSHRFIARVLLISLYAPYVLCVFRFTDCRP